MSAPVEREDAFNLLLREIVLLGIFAVTMLSVAFALGNSWRRRQRCTTVTEATVFEELPVDMTALPFSISVVSLALSLTSVVALPMTIIMVTQVITGVGHERGKEVLGVGGKSAAVARAFRLTVAGVGVRLLTPERCAHMRVW